MRLYGTIEMSVKKIVQLTHDVKQFYLFPLDGKALPAFTGGSHITTYVSDGVHSFERDYSLTSSPIHREYYSIAIHRSPNSRGGSEYWHTHIKEGDHVSITPPKNHFALSYRAKHHVFYAAGIGITPFLTMMEEVKRQGGSFELHYSARTSEQCAFYNSIQTLYRDRTRFYFTRTENGQRIATNQMKHHAIGSHVYFCGPQAMVTEFRDAAYEIGYPSGSVHFEVFSLDDGERYPFQVELAASSRTLIVEEGETLLDALLREGVDAPYSCKAGGCGQCEVPLIEGDVDHRDIFYTEEERLERGVILTCCSRTAKENESLTIHL
ncbi:MAG TPA: PDR/VanB family oxidoreductase [Savagea sp.]